VGRETRWKPRRGRRARVRDPRHTRRLAGGLAAPARAAAVVNSTDRGFARSPRPRTGAQALQKARLEEPFVRLIWDVDVHCPPRLGLRAPQLRFFGLRTVSRFRQRATATRAEPPGWQPCYRFMCSGVDEDKRPAKRHKHSTILRRKRLTWIDFLPPAGHAGSLEGQLTQARSDSRRA